MLDHAEHSNGFISAKPGPRHWDWKSLRRQALAEARRVLRDESQAQDAAQEALIRAWRYSAGCADPAHPGPWLRVIAKREALRILGRPGPTPPPDTPDASGDQPMAHAAIDLRTAVVSRLNELDRMLVLQRYWMGMTDREIAARQRLPVGTVKTRLHRARGTLKVALDDGATTAGHGAPLR